MFYILLDIIYTYAIPMPYNIKIKQCECLTVFGFVILSLFYRVYKLPDFTLTFWPFYKIRSLFRFQM